METTPAENTQWKEHKCPEGYDQKFASLTDAIATCKKQNADRFVVAWPWVLGDTNEEIIESMSRIAEADLVLCITGRYVHKESK